MVTSSKHSGVTEDQRALGDRIRRFRRDRQLTQLDLARRVGVTNGQISTIERGLSAPSIGTLHRIAGALGVSIVAFFEPARRKDIRIVRRGARQRVLSPGSPEVLEVLAGARGLFACEIRLERGDACVRPGCPESAETFLHVLKGQVELRCENERYVLKSGDSLHADARLSRRLGNVGESEALILEVMSGS